MREMRGARRVRLAALLLLVAMTAHTRALLAQQLTGTVRDSASQIPLSGAVVLVLEPSGRAAARGRTDQQGQFKLFPWASKSARSAAGRLRLRILRMGFRPLERPLTGPAVATTLDISVVSFPIVLEEVLVKAAPSCPKRPDRAAALALLKQVRTALYANVVARSQSSATMTRLLYQRLDDETGHVLRQTVRTKVTSATSEPFSAARSAEAFGRQGFLEDSTGSHTYVGPDAETLIDDAFAERYCFKIIAPDRGRTLQVGLGFEPAAREDTGHVDFVGTLWVDTLSRVLKDLTFRYVGLDRQTSALSPEGRLSFRELSNGVVIIDQWSIRLGPGRTRDVMASGARGSRDQEIGGEIARASWPDGFTWRAPLGTVHLRVVDGQSQPAAGSMVELVDTDYEATTDATGMFVLSDLLPGPYTATIRDPRLVALDIPSTTTLRFSAMRDSTIEALRQVETAEDFVRRRCSADARAMGDAWVLGRVVWSDARPVPDARWTIRDEFGSVLVEGGRVDGEGLFHSCQLPLNKRISIDVWRDEKRANASRVVMDRLTTLRFVLPP
jgi:hypothetical protein